MKRRSLLMMLGGALLALPSSAAETWVALGTRRVQLRNEIDFIPVGVTQGLFRSIRLRVTGNGIFMHKLKVTFSNGESVELPIRAFIAKGTETRDLWLPGAVRAIRLIEMTYRRIPGGGEAQVTVLGRPV